MDGKGQYGLAELGWDEIADIAAQGRARERFCVGDEKTETLYTGETVAFVIIDFDHDRREGKGKAGITFALKGVLDARLKMNEEYSNIGGWRDSAMRTRYMDRILRLLPTELRRNIKPVIKSTGVGGRSREIVQTVDKLFLFSANEVYGTGECGHDIYDDVDTYAANGEGEQYLYFFNPVNRIVFSIDDEEYWWLRSPHVEDDKFFCHLCLGGELGCSGSQAAQAVRFGFCL